MSTFTLKIIACITMLIDHITVLFVPEDYGYLFHLDIGSYERDITLYVIGRVIGRIAFPLFAFLIVQGFFHTRNVKKYMLRLAIFALISEIPYDFAMWGFPDPKFIFFRQNIFFTLLLGLIAITCLDWIQKNYKNKIQGGMNSQNARFFTNLYSSIVIIAASVSLILINGSYLEYGYGVLVIIGFYFGYRSKWVTLIIFILLTGFLCGDIQFMAILAAPFIHLYNGEKGPSYKYAFYLFYPIHLVVLKLIQLAIE